MKCVVLSGSPKGTDSVTLQYVRYLEREFPEVTFTVLHISPRIKRLEVNEREFQAVLDVVAEADVVMWAFPVYFMLVPSQYMRFMNLVWERGAEGVFAGKYATVLMTSLHFFDHTALQMMSANCEDMGMTMLECYSANMYDLLDEGQRGQFRLYGAHLIETVRRGVRQVRTSLEERQRDFVYQGGAGAGAIDTGGKKVLVVTDAKDQDRNVAGMIDRFVGAFSNGADVTVANLYDVKINGGCQGCIHCSFDNECVYAGIDGYVEFFNEVVRPADILIFAGRVAHRGLSWKWKEFFDRSFFNTHIPRLHGKQFGFILSGSVKENPWVSEILNYYGTAQPSNVVGFVTDECEDSRQIDVELDYLAERLVQHGAEAYIAPAMFHVVTGRKLFRDEVWGRLRFVMQADHKHYKENGFYDFPQKDYRARFANLLLMGLTKIPKMRREFQKRMKTEMVKPYKEVISEK